MTATRFNSFIYSLIYSVLMLIIMVSPTAIGEADDTEPLRPLALWAPCLEYTAGERDVELVLDRFPMQNNRKSLRLTVYKQDGTASKAIVVPDGVLPGGRTPADTSRIILMLGDILPKLSFR